MSELKLWPHDIYEVTTSTNFESLKTKLDKALTRKGWACCINLTMWNPHRHRVERMKNKSVIEKQFAMHWAWQTRSRNESCREKIGALLLFS